MSSSRRGPLRRRNVRWARARSRMATSSWAAVSSAGVLLAAVDAADDAEAAADAVLADAYPEADAEAADAAVAAGGAVRAARAAPRASVSDMLSENRSLSTAAT